jgi:hypothetical protein
MNPETNIEVLLDLWERLYLMLHWVCEGMTEEAFVWAPDEEGNSSAVTLWHICRAWDLLKVRILENRPPEQERWFLDGWSDRTSYDPRGLGYAGFGNLAGYTVKQMKAVPALFIAESLRYLDGCWESLDGYLRTMNSGELFKPPEGWPRLPEPSSSPESIYQVLCNFIGDGYQHLGEIRAIRALWERKQRGAA